MPLTTAFVIYLTLFRLAIVAAGATAIVLGYRLFVAGVWPDAMTRATSIQVDVSGSRLTLKNAAPGSVFALCGFLMIVTVFATSSPQLTIDLIGQASTLDGQAPTGRLTMRGRQIETIPSLTEQGDSLVAEGRTDEAIASYEKALRVVAAPANHLAWLYLGQGRISDALPLSRLAVEMRPDDPNFLDTLAEILLKGGDPKGALEVIERAAQLDPQFASKLRKFREAAR